MNEIAIMNTSFPSMPQQRRFSASSSSSSSGSSDNFDDAYNEFCQHEIASSHGGSTRSLISRERSLLSRELGSPVPKRRDAHSKSKGMSTLCDVAEGVELICNHSSGNGSTVRTSLTKASSNWVSKSSFGSFDENGLKMLERELANVDIVKVCDDDCYSAGGKLLKRDSSKRDDNNSSKRDINAVSNRNRRAPLKTAVSRQQSCDRVVAPIISAPPPTNPARRSASMDMMASLQATSSAARRPAARRTGSMDMVSPSQKAFNPRPNDPPTTDRYHPAQLSRASSSQSNKKMDPPATSTAPSEQDRHPSRESSQTFSRSSSGSEADTVNTSNSARRRHHLHLLEEECQQRAADAARKRADALRRHLLDEEVKYSANEISDALKRWYASGRAAAERDDEPPPPGLQLSSGSSAGKSSTSHDGNYKSGGEETGASSKKSSSAGTRTMSDPYVRQQTPRVPPRTSRRRYGEEKWEVLEEDEETLDEPDDLDATSVQYRERRRMSQQLYTVEEVDDYQQRLRRSSVVTHHSASQGSSQESPVDEIVINQRPPPQQKEHRKNGNNRNEQGRSPPRLSEEYYNARAGPISERKRKVRFTSLQIRQYERIMGDNPSCSAGPPLSIGWTYDPTTVYFTDIDKYERQRSEDRIPGKYCRALIVPRQERESILKDLGYTDRDFAKAVRKIIKAKNKRRQTINNLSLSNVEEFMEGMNRGLMKAVMGKKEKKIVEAMSGSDGGGVGGSKDGIGKVVGSSGRTLGTTESTLPGSEQSLTPLPVKKNRKPASSWRTKSGKLKGNF